MRGVLLVLLLACVSCKAQVKTSSTDTSDNGTKVGLTLRGNLGIQVIEDYPLYVTPDGELEYGFEF